MLSRKVPCPCNIFLLGWGFYRKKPNALSAAHCTSGNLQDRRYLIALRGLALDCQDRFAVPSLVPMHGRSCATNPTH